MSHSAGRGCLQGSARALGLPMTKVGVCDPSSSVDVAEARPARPFSHCRCTPSQNGGLGRPRTNLAANISQVTGIHDSFRDVPSASRSTPDVASRRKRHR